jgi:hypothetical protein
VKGIRLFRDRRDYERFVLDEIVAEPLLRDHPFYRNLVQFVIDAKAPVFYWQSDPSEHANFSAYYNFVLVRETYTNPVLRAMYFLHDFAHMLFYYPHDMASVTSREFEEAAIVSEYAASNETEVLAHYRVGGLRARVLQDRRILYDILRDRGTPQPPVASLFELRRLLVETESLDCFFFSRPEDEPVRQLLKSYGSANGAWCKRRFTETLRLPNPAEYHYPFLTPRNYERVLGPYTSAGSQADYERTVLRNIRLAFALFGLPDPPGRFEECLEKKEVLEGRVMFPPDPPRAAARE